MQNWRLNLLENCDLVKPENSTVEKQLSDGFSVNHLNLLDLKGTGTYLALIYSLKSPLESGAQLSQEQCNNGTQSRYRTKQSHLIQLQTGNFF